MIEETCGDETNLIIKAPNYRKWVETIKNNAGECKQAHIILGVKFDYRYM